MLNTKTPAMKLELKKSHQESEINFSIHLVWVKVTHFRGKFSGFVLFLNQLIGKFVNFGNQ